MRCIPTLSIIVFLAWLSGCATSGGERGPTQVSRSGAPLVRIVPRVEVNLIAMGDWGSGGKNQQIVANTLAQYVAQNRHRFDAAILAGDNFYSKLGSVDDPIWQTHFEQMYNHAALRFPFYASLGNHDYEDGKYLIEMEYSLLNPESRFKLPNRWYRVDLPEARPLVTILMLDSNRTLMGAERWQDQLQWMRAQLNAPNRSRWVIACAHHPLFSNGDHGDNGVLQREWGPIFQQYQLDLYVCGHDHDLQHIELPDRWTTFLLVGGGGAGIRSMRNDRRGPYSKSSYGFAHLRFRPDHVVVKLIDGSNGSLLHRIRRTASGSMTVLETTESSAAVPRTVKSLTRPDAATTQSNK